MKRLLCAIFAFAMLGVVSCEVESNEPYYVLYVSARVVDEAGFPIQGIFAYPEGGEFVGRLGYTDHNGKIYGRAYLTPRKRWVMCFEDVDGEYNRGEYQPLTQDISDLVPPTQKPDRWGFSGSSLVEMGTVVLTLKETN